MAHYLRWPVVSFGGVAAVGPRTENHLGGASVLPHQVEHGGAVTLQFGSPLCQRWAPVLGVPLLDIYSQVARGVRQSLTQTGSLWAEGNLRRLDAKLRVTMRAELRRFHIDLSATTIYVTHDQLEAMTMSDMIAVMHGGIVQQFGTPAEVYGQPANLFVAGFIGSPPMNLIAGELAGGHVPVFASPGLRLPLPGFAAGKPSGRNVVLGVRPQDLELVGEQEPADLRERVWVVELLGSEKLIEVEYGERRRVTVQVRAETAVNVDDPVGVRLDARRVHLFDTSIGAALRF